MKKSLLILLAAILVSSSFCVTTLAGQIFVDTFDASTDFPAGYTNKTPGIADGVVTIEKSPKTTGNALKFVDENNSSHFFLSGPAAERIFEPQRDRLEISMDIIPMQTTNHFNIMILDNLKNIVAASIQLIENGTIRVYFNDSANSYQDVFVYEAEELLNIKVSLDVNQNAFDLYINNELRLSDSPFNNRSLDSGIKYGRTACEQINSIWFQTGVGVGTVFIDNVSLSDFKSAGGSKIDYALLDVIGTDYYNAVEFLQTLSIVSGYEDKTFKPEEYITRAEFSKIIVNMLGLYTSENKNYFWDVLPDHWAAGNISSITDLGIINGFPGGEFRPEEYITMIDAAKILVSALGYDVKAVAKGGYPFGYRMVAEEIGIMSGVSYTDYAKRGDIAKMAANAMEIDLMKPISFGGEIEYKIEKNVNLLSEMDIYKDRGIITETYLTALQGESRLNKNEVKINNNIYLESGISADKHFGKNVVFYYRDNEYTNRKELIYIREQNTNETLTIHDKDIIRELTTAKRLVYEAKNGKNISIDIPNKIDVIYNGKAYFNFDTNENTFKPKYGNVTFIDNNGDGKYEIAVVNSYEAYYVSYINKLDYVIIDKYGKESITLDPADDIHYVITRDDKPVEFSEIKPQNVLLVAKSLDGKAYNILVSDTKMTAEVTERLTDSKGKDHITVEGVDYELLDNLRENLELGNTYNLYFDSFSRIGGIEKNQVTGNYAYLLDLSLKRSAGFSLSFKVFDSKRGLAYFSDIERIVIDDVVVNTAEKLATCVKLYDGAEIKPQLIMYMTDNDDNVISIKTAVDSTAEKYNANDFALVGKSASMRYDQYRINKYFTVNDSTIVMYVPRDSDEKKMELMRVSDFVSGEYYDAELYDASRFSEISVVVIREKTNSWLNVWSKFAVVSSISNVVNEEEEQVYSLSYYNEAGSLTKINTVLPSEIRNADVNKAWGYDTYKFEQLKKGDIIQLQANSKNVLVEFKLLYSPDGGDYFDVIEGGDEQIPDIHLVYAVVEDSNGTFVKFKCGDAGSPYSYNITDTKFYKLQKSSGTLKKANKDQASVGKNIAIAFHRFTPVLAMIIEE